MMSTRITTTLAALGLVALLVGPTQATVLEFGGHGSNEDMAFDYGSNISAGIAGEFDISNGATPNVALTWGPQIPNVLEFHNASTWVAPLVAPGVLQLDVDTSSQNGQFPADPTVDFSVPAGVRVRINSLIIGNANDQHIDDGHEPANDWTINLIRLSDSATVFTHTTTACGVATQGSGCGEVVNIDYTGDPGVSYRLLFDDGGDNTTPSHTGGIGDHPRGAIDNLSFNQIPEPTTMALLALLGLGAVGTRRRS
ncbi:PEP-CTERM sorting domain-containing protein [Bythopirellula polymerisocia]|uniref:Ice-binding protein C-terminal domain-containing protein n=1 Tax=Bythopirellula polymerisocia TaxID=2528003 RepID=A0A5C6CRA9_9BACT|nr:PEP-CTERM sorting domain-containing protein [Bythopirellula polymerisocia]TWU26084.1 hypothetical protein Pla144_33010 [Bythopirellula polymerisocia]